MQNNQKYFYIYDNENIYIKIFYDDIYYIETIKSTHYCIIYSKSGHIKKRISINEMIKKLPSFFFRCSSSAIVNSLKIQRVDCSNFILYLEDNYICRYSINYKIKIKELLKRKL